MLRLTSAAMLSAAVRSAGCQIWATSMSEVRSELPMECNAVLDDSAVL